MELCHELSQFSKKTVRLKRRSLLNKMDFLNSPPPLHPHHHKKKKKKKLQESCPEYTVMLLLKAHFAFYDMYTTVLVSKGQFFVRAVPFILSTPRRVVSWETTVLGGVFQASFQMHYFPDIQALFHKGFAFSRFAR